MTPAPLTVDLLTNTATRGDRSVVLSPQRAEILAALLAAKGRALSTDSLIARLYGACDEPENALGNLRVQLSYLRRDLRPLDVRIVSLYGRGYGIQLLEQQPRVASALIDAALAGASA